MELDGEKVLAAVIRGKINGAKITLNGLGDNVHPMVDRSLRFLIDELEDALKISIEIKSSRNN
jgi:hypothetical protein